MLHFSKKIGKSNVYLQIPNRIISPWLWKLLSPTIVGVCAVAGFLTLIPFLVWISVYRLPPCSGGGGGGRGGSVPPLGSGKIGCAPPPPWMSRFSRIWSKIEQNRASAPPPPGKKAIINTGLDVHLHSCLPSVTKSSRNLKIRRHKCQSPARYFQRFPFNSENKRGAGASLGRARLSDRQAGDVSYVWWIS